MTGIDPAMFELFREEVRSHAATLAADCSMSRRTRRTPLGSNRSCGPRTRSRARAGSSGSTRACGWRTSWKTHSSRLSMGRFV